MKPLFLSLLLLPACGADTAEPTEKPYQTGGGIVVTPDDPKKEVVVEYRKDDETYTLVVPDTHDLPECTRANSGQLAWIKSTDQYLTCLGSAWVESPVKGEIKPTDPVDNTPPVVPETLAENEWKDPATGNHWLLGATVVLPPYGDPCGPGWALAPAAALASAVQRGLIVALGPVGGSPTLWSDDWLTPQDGYPRRVYVDAQGVTAIHDVPTAAGIACLRGEP